ncbi:MAG: esterase family protein [Flavobacterium sp.]|nr:esterase family protein [Flavobacterium sp.]
MKNYFSLFLLLTNTLFAAKVDTLEIVSKSMGRTLKTAVVTPTTYSKSKLNYPVVYLLHGAYGHFQDWLKKTPTKNVVAALADQYNLIIVLPEGETFSFYLDSPISKESQFETFITQEVIQKVDANYRTIATNKGRVITGLSMGGHGALYLSSKHPELFCAAGSMSGAVDMSTIFNPENLERMKPLITPILGTEISSAEVLEKYAVLGKIEVIKNNKLPLIIDCGVDDFLIENNRELHRRLVYNKVPHDYTERSGAHTWEYWENALPYHILFLKLFLRGMEH